MKADLQKGIARWLSARLANDAPVEVTDLRRIPGGASRETYRFLAKLPGRERRLILRRDPESSLIETERRVEFAAYTAFHQTTVPVPRPVGLETDATWLGSPFFVMEEVEGCESAVRKLAEDPWAQHVERIGQQKWLILGQIAGADPAALGLTDVLEPVAPEDCWRRELERWERVIDEDEIAPQPIVRAAIRRLRRNPPPPAQRVVTVHGDFRSGNFLFDRGGAIRAILDWEMCHLGDPLEDLAWAMNPIWAAGDPSRPGRLIERERAIRIWEESSGFRVDREAFAWWELFSSVKGQAIWISSSKEYASGRSTEPILLFAGWMCTDLQDRILVEALAPKRAQP